MSRQVAVRLPEDIVDFVDGLVKEGKASSRAVVVTRALERERRRAAAARDAAILAVIGEDPDMDSLARHAARTLTRVTVAPITTTVQGLSRS